jgi:hypothetical protein
MKENHQALHVVDGVKKKEVVFCRRKYAAFPPMKPPTWR